MTEIDFYINHTNPVHTNQYPLEDIGFLNAHDNTYIIFNFSSLFVPEMGLIYKDNEQNTQWGMVGYYNQSNIPPVFDLHLMNSLVQGECSSLSRDLIINSPLQNIVHDCINLPAFEMPLQITINRFNMNLNSNDCD